MKNVPIKLWVWLEDDGEGNPPWPVVMREKFDYHGTERWWGYHLDGTSLADALWPDGVPPEWRDTYRYVEGSLESEGSGGDSFGYDDYDEWFEPTKDVHYRFSRLRMWLWSKWDAWKARRREARILKIGGCVCRCPQCKSPLNDQATCEDVEDHRAPPDCTVEYTCQVCGAVSRFRFDMPVPVYMKPEMVPLKTSDFKGLGGK